MSDQALLEITRSTGIVDGLIYLADQDVNVEKLFHWLACQAVAFGAQVEKWKMWPAFTPLRRGSLAFSLRSKAKAGGGPCSSSWSDMELSILKPLKTIREPRFV